MSIKGDMTKNEILSQLRRAKSAHLQWRSYAQALIVGIPVTPEQVPMLHTDCRFGQWYYGPGQALASLGAFAAIEGPHERLHRVYRNIFKRLFGEEHGEAYRDKVGDRAGLTPELRREMEGLMGDLVRASGELLQPLAALEREVMEMPEDDAAPVR